jgi:hypothetical protein
MSESVSIHTFLLRVEVILFSHPFLQQRLTRTNRAEKESIHNTLEYPYRTDMCQADLRPVVLNKR